jgi:antibiotic biosynthesis monooxygenase (ABM) superfamily enzyme
MERDRRTQNPPSGSVTEVITRDIVPGREHEFERWAHRLVSATARYGATDTIITPDAATPARRVFVLHFANEEALGAWEASQERDRLVQEARKFSTPDVQQATGLETWFVLPGQRAIVPPPRWTMLLVTLIGAYPLVVLLSAFVLPSLEGWPLLVRAAVVPVVLLSLMTYLVMPQLTRLLSGWLYPNQRRHASR